jgi:hypothetical protein
MHPASIVSHHSEKDSVGEASVGMGNAGKVGMAAAAVPISTARRVI